MKYYILHGQGLGDFIMYSESVKKIFSKELESFYLIHENRFLNSIKQLYSDTENVDFISLTEARKTLNQNNLIDLGYQTYTFSFLLGSKFFHDLTINRDIEKENNLYNNLIESLGTDEYNLIHSRNLTNTGNKMKPVKYKENLGNNYPCINLDYDSEDLELLSIKTNNIFDYCTILEKAKELHFYEGSFSNLTDRINTKNMKYCYVSCKNEQHTEYIKHLCLKGLWHKNKWRYIG